MPSLSLSAPTTVYRKLTVEPDTERYAACRVLDPMLSASCGDPVTTTVPLNVTSTSMFAPAAYGLKEPIDRVGVDVMVTPVTTAAPSLFPTTCACATARVSMVNVTEAESPSTSVAARV